MTRAKLIHRIAMGTMLIVAGPPSCGCDFSLGLDVPDFRELALPNESPPRRGPTINAPDKVTATQEVQVSFRADATNATYFHASLAKLPEGNDAQFHTFPGSFRGDFTWTPTSEDSGAFDVTFTAMDNEGGGSLRKTTIYVSAAASGAAPVAASRGEMAP